MASRGHYLPPVDYDMAIQAVTHGYEHIARLQSLLQHLPHDDPWSELARHVSQEAADALLEALCFLQPAGKSPGDPSGDPVQVAATSWPSNSYNALDSQIPIYPCVQESSNPKGKRYDAELFRNVTVWPDYVDQYQWRKYGQKKIRGTDFDRSYYRCTHFNDQCCSATKRVQQIDRDDPPKFLVTYFGEHTCNSSSSMAANFQDTTLLPVKLQQENVLCFNSAYSEKKKEQVDHSESTDQAFNSWMMQDSSGRLIGKRDEMAAAYMVENYQSSSELASISSEACADQETSYSTTYPFRILDGTDMVCRELIEFIEFDGIDVKPLWGNICP